MGRKYIASGQVLASSFPNEYANFYLTAPGPLARITRISVQENDTTLAGPQDLPVVVNRIYGSPITPGVGGTLVTPTPKDRGDAASTAVVLMGASTLSVGGNTSLLYVDSPYLYSGSDSPGAAGIVVTGTDLIQVKPLSGFLSGVAAVTVTIEWEEEGIAS